MGHAAESSRKRGAMKPATPKMCGDEGTVQAHKPRHQTAKYDMFFLPSSTFVTANLNVGVKPWFLYGWIFMGLTYSSVTITTERQNTNYT